MYAYIKGNITHKSPTHAILDVQGVGYELSITLQTYSLLEGKEEAKLWTHLSVREDDMSLYGFGTQDERALFRKLISVSGIGTNTARLILSGLRVDEVKHGVLYEDVALFKQVKGIGKKTAQRLILDLKDKLDDLGEEETIDVKKAKTENNTSYEEALSGLLGLGFKKSHVLKALKTVRKESGNEVESSQIIKSALKILS